MFEFYEEMGLSREELLEKLHSAVKPSRFQHCLGVEKAAVKLAKKYNANVYKAGLAGLLHDYAKEVSNEEFLSLIDEYNLNPELKKWGNSIWHSMVGIYKLQEDLGLQDSEILRAIEIHTVGAAEMTTLDKVVYVADYTEENRDFPGVEEARRLAFESLDKAVAFETARTVEYLAEKYLPIYPQALETYNTFVKFFKKG